MNRKHINYLALTTCLLSSLAKATEFESLKTALETTLGKGAKIVKKKLPLDGKDYDVYYTKDKDGKALKLASVQTALYMPDCTHTWVIGMVVKNKEIEVEQVRVLEMKCKHAFPAKEKDFLSQYEGKKVSDLKTLDKKINTVATATYTALYTTDAVKRSLNLASKVQ